MAGLDTFEAELESALEARRAEIEENDLPALKQHCQRMNSSFQAIHNLLRKKGLLKEDPYKYEERLSELDTPSDAPYTEQERDKELSVRLGQYETRIAYLADYFDFSLDTLDLKRLKGVVKFMKYINWRNVSDTATQPTTRGLGEQLMKVKRGSDVLSANIVKDAQDQLSAASRDALSILKRVTSYRRELYKLDVRRSVLTDSRVPATPDESEYPKAVEAARSVFSKHLPGYPFARDLILEIFAENSPNGGDTIRQALLDELSVKQTKQEAEKPRDDLKEMLLEAARAIAGSSRGLEEAARKLSDNAIVLESRKVSFGEMMKQIMARLFGKTEETRTYTIEYMDPNRNSRTTEDLDFDDFVNGIGRRARIYNGILSRSGPGWKKLEQRSDDGLLQFVTKDAQELYAVIRRLEGLEEYFKAEVPREQRSQLRSIATEITTINDSLIRGRKKTREYVAKIEEREQLKKLGITPS